MHRSERYPQAGPAGGENCLPWPDRHPWQSAEGQRGGNWYMTRFTRWTALAVAAALLTAGCSGSGSSDDDSREKGGNGDDGKGGKGNVAALDWGECKASGDAPAPGDDWQCATLQVPLDWSKPEGSTIGLALIRAKATGGDRA